MNKSRPRSLRLEALEERQLLSVSPFSAPNAAPTVLYDADMSANMNVDDMWALDEGWRWGQPLGGGGYDEDFDGAENGNPDPTWGATGPYVIGYNLEGNYPHYLPPAHATLGPIDCSIHEDVSLSFWRYLNVGPVLDRATVDVSTDGVNWTTVWRNPSLLTDSSWSQHAYDLSEFADGESDVYIRWTMGPTDGIYNYSGWNIDDVVVEGVVGKASIEGDLWFDRDANGAIDPHEGPVAGVTVYHDGNNNGVLDPDEPTAITDRDGHYILNGLDAGGTYAVRPLLTGDWAQTYPAGDASQYVYISSIHGEDGVNFGLTSPHADIAGVVWSDADGDGNRDLGEPGQAGVTVYHDSNLNGAYDPVFHHSYDSGPVFQPIAISPGASSFTLQVNDRFSVEEVRVSLSITHPFVGDLRARLIGPDGTAVDLFTNVGADGDNFLGTVFDDKANARIVDAAAPFDGVYQPEGRLSDFNGLLSEGEWTLELIDTELNDSGALLGWELTLGAAGEVSAKTDSDGLYILTVLEEGALTIGQVVPLGSEQSYPQNQHAVTLTLGDSVPNVDFGNEPVSAAVTGVVWADDNLNGARDPGEEGLPGQTLYLDLDGGGDLDPGEPVAVSAGDGSYQFVGLTPGDYTVRWADNAELLGQIAPTSGAGRSVTLGLGEVARDADFGLAPVEGEISGVVWFDSNGDAVRALTEYGVSGVQLFLDANNDGQWNEGEALAETAWDGSYVFRNVAPGVPYAVRVVVGDQWKQQTPTNARSVTLSDRELVSGVDYGLVFNTGEVSGIVWNDLNGNGSKSSSEPGLAGWTVFLDNNLNGRFDEWEPSTTTDASGNYLFDGLAPGHTYTIGALNRAGWRQTKPASDGVHVVDVAPGGEYIRRDFGFTASTMADWSVLVYMNGDSPLEEDAINDFLEMAEIGSTADVNIVVQMDRRFGYYAGYGNWTDTRRGLVMQGDMPTAAWGASIGEVNMASANTVIEFVDWAQETYPANNCALILWDAGDEFRPLGQDATPYNSFTLSELGSMADGIDGVDIIGFDASQMGMLEVGYQVADGADIMVASEEFVASTGWGYEAVLDYLTTHPTATPEQFASSIVDSFAPYYDEFGFGDETHSAIDLAPLRSVDSAFMTAFERFTDVLRNNLTTTDRQFVDAAVAASHHFGYGDSVDLMHVLRTIGLGAENLILRDAADDLLAELESVIVANRTASDAEDAGGLAVYWPTTGALDSAYNGSLDFVVDTQWDEFLTGTTTTDGVISGVVWDDANGNGTRDGEPGLVGRTVYLDMNGDGVFNNDGVATANSGVGDWAIGHASETVTAIYAPYAGTVYDLNLQINLSLTSMSRLTAYLVAPDGTTLPLFTDVAGDIDDPISLTLDDQAIASLTGLATGDFLSQHPLSRFNGVDVNGFWELHLIDETLMGTAVLSDWSLDFDRTEPNQTTDGDGAYAFNDMPGGAYRVGQVLPGGWTQTSPVMSHHDITLPGNGTADFGTSDNHAKVTGRVWVDANANGYFDGWEGAAEGFIVFADVDASGDLSAGDISTTLLENGDYYLIGLEAGVQYTILVDLPANWSPAFPVAGEYTITLPAGGHATNRDFAAAPELSTISGYVFEDTNSDGVWDSVGGEPALAGWTVFLDEDGDFTLDPGEIWTTSDSSGYYEFIDLLPGQYTVVEVTPPGWRLSTPDEVIVLPSVPSPAPAALPAYTTNAPDDVYIHSTSIPTTGDAVVTPRTVESLPLINLDTLRTELPEFADFMGQGYSVVVIDSGARLDHAFFGPDSDSDNVADRIVAQRDFVDNDFDSTDGHGHGTHVASIIASESDTCPGVAPEVNIIPLRVLDDQGAGTAADLERALQWVIQNAGRYNIVSVNMSIGIDSGVPLNLTTPTSMFGLGDELAVLSAMDVITVASAGNDYGQFETTGVGYPAADPNVISVGAVFDADVGAWNTGGTVEAYLTSPDQVTPFSQRHPELTPIFAPGAVIEGAAITGGAVNDETTFMSGTSQAAPHVTGVAIIAQQIAEYTIGRRLTLTEFTSLIHQSGVWITDTDQGDPIDWTDPTDVGDPSTRLDSVKNSDLSYRRVDMYALAEAIVALGVTNHYQITLNAGDTFSDVNFGNQKYSAVMDGVVWNDADQDRVRDPGEEGLDGWTVYVDMNGNNVLDAEDRTTTTDENGYYVFEGLPEVNTRVYLVVNPGWNQTFPIWTYHPIDLQLGESQSGDFGVARPPQPVAPVESMTSISGTVWEDLGNFGTRDADESGVAGWRVCIDTNGNGAYDAGEPLSITDIDGRYAFQDLDAGTYRIVASPESYWTRTSWPPTYTVDLQPYQQQSDLDFGFRQFISDAWTVMLYLDGDNALESAALRQFLEAAAIGTSPNVNIVALLDRGGVDPSYEGWTQAHRGVIHFGDAPYAGWGESLGEVNMGDTQTLADFVAWTTTNHPAQNYALIVQGEGDGLFTVAADATDADSLTLLELDAALADGPTIDVLTLEASNTGTLEFAYELGQEADRIVAYAEQAPAAGIPYDTMLSRLRDNTTANAGAFAGMMVDAFQAEYEANGVGTESIVAINASTYQAPAFAAAVNDFSQWMLVTASRADWEFVRNMAADSAAMSLEMRDLWDMMDRIHRFTTNPMLGNLALAVKQSMDVPGVGYTGPFSSRTSIGVFAPTVWPAAYPDNTTFQPEDILEPPIVLQFLDDLLWDDMLMASAPVAASISGFVWNDLNDDGTMDPGEDVLADQRVYFDLNENGVFDDLGTIITVSDQTPAAFNGGDTCVSRIEVAEDGFLFDLDVVLNIEHADLSGLLVTLVAPNGTIIELLDRTTSGSNLVNTVFDDESAFSSQETLAPMKGRVRPNEALSQLDGISTAGVWELHVTDLSGENDGLLLDWALHMNATEPNVLTDVNGAYAFDDLTTERRRISVAPTQEWAVSSPVGGSYYLTFLAPGSVTGINFGLEEAFLIVTTLDDEIDGDFSANDISLREAVMLAAADPGIDRIEFAPGLAGETIVLDPVLGEIVLDADVRITGLPVGGAPGIDNVTIQSAVGRRAFAMYDAAPSVALSGINIVSGFSATYGGAVLVASGSLELSDVHISQSHADLCGGALAVLNGAAATALNSTFESNSASFGGTFYVDAGSALNLIDSTVTLGTADEGGVVFAASQARVVVEGGLMENNSADGSGGAVHAAGGDAYVEIKKSPSGASPVLRMNTAALFGGGLFAAAAAEIVMTDGDITDADALLGGAAAAYAGGSLTFSHVTIGANNADLGGALFVARDGSSASLDNNTIVNDNNAKRGGGLFVYDDASADIGDSTLDDNAAERSGGALYVDGENASAQGDGFWMRRNTAGVQGGGVHVANQATVTLDNGSIVGGGVESGDDNSAVQGGGVAVLGGGEVTLTNVAVTDHKAVTGAGVFVAGTDRTGAVPSKADLNASSVDDNLATLYGGGIHVQNGGEVDADLVLVRGNEAGRHGGGIATIGADTYVNIHGGSELIGNTGVNGGGLYLLRATADLDGVDINNNVALGVGGGIAAYGANATLGTMSITANTADNGGGGVYVSEDSTVTALTGLTDISLNTSLSGEFHDVKGDILWLAPAPAAAPIDFALSADEDGEDSNDDLELAAIDLIYSDFDEA